MENNFSAILNSLQLKKINAFAFWFNGDDSGFLSCEGLTKIVAAFVFVRTKESERMYRFCPQAKDKKKVIENMNNTYFLIDRYNADSKKMGERLRIYLDDESNSFHCETENVVEAFGYCVGETGLTLLFSFGWTLSGERRSELLVSDHKHMLSFATAIGGVPNA